MDVNDIDAQIAALEAARKQAIANANDAAKPAFAAIVPEYDWRVDWKDEYSLAIECRQSPGTVAAYESWKAAHPTSSIALPQKLGQWHGMRHLLVGNVLATAWGGSIVLNIPRDFGKDYHLLTDPQAADLRNGVVPEELRKPW